MWLAGRKLLVTATELAELAGVSRQMVYRWIRAGMPAMVSRKRWVIPYAEARKWLQRRGRKLPKPYDLLPG